MADLRGVEAALTGAQVNLGYTRIEAPGDGTVANGRFDRASWSPRHASDPVREQSQMGTGQIIARRSSRT